MTKLQRKGNTYRKQKQEQLERRKAEILSGQEQWQKNELQLKLNLAKDIKDNKSSFNRYFKSKRRKTESMGSTAE